ncbi:MAG TPA: hypothetical protein DCQ26_17340 [Marinilabiliales bacterium]|nr:MAG: hypothetical protein A2W95_11745 [Bacteroidetes bacterium GWA2_40_14]OFX57383.1 MAG: hypothetical protein A2W84_03755 [Bacteroidetes bacterium GWC2_40_13]OFX74792.1 MAG: hypothetical protein A2W96_14890 [Bacteroidetes bacterium GWD2_40_43]OFX91965.1 MAG: hypothetical protein A2W97_15730 [Bacteroidetes bacterium GWE2_40_63]OFY24618.1 MAG: hypothetical protein A2W88_11055 [Bacteroidetes bacterium GWF2_40_13]OFZ26860.1 MAG: hypothetical protein A2437_08220 [Bacteroidetes bacterium RIFOXYC
MDAEKPESRQNFKSIEMKKIIYVLGIFLLFGNGLRAQYFAGGSLSFSHNGGSFDDGTTTTDKVSTTSFMIAPKGGYILSEKLWVGMQIGFGVDKTKTPGATEVIAKESVIGFMPFARYYAFQFNKLSLGIQGQFGLSFHNEKTETGGTTTDGPKGTGISFYVLPGLSYSLNDRIDLEAQIGGLSLGYSSYTEKEEVAGVTTKDKSNGFIIGADMDDILTTGLITVGATIKF